MSQKTRLRMSHAAPIITIHMSAFFKIVRHFVYCSSLSRAVTIINHQYNAITNATKPRSPSVQLINDFTILSIRSSSLFSCTHHIFNSALATIVSSSDAESEIPNPKFFSVANVIDQRSTHNIYVHRATQTNLILILPIIENKQLYKV